MSSCDAIDLIACLEGEDPDINTAEHLKGCPRCRKELEIYRQLLNGIVTVWGPETQPCPQRERTLKSCLGETGPQAEHLAECLECRDLYTMVTEALKDMENEPDLSSEPLPPAVLQKVAEKKKRWLSIRAKKVLDFHPTKGHEDETARLKRLLEETDDSLPLAAFPDDLTDKENNEDD